MPRITLEELHSYHAIDREVFSRLVVVLRRNPAESLLVMATWLWLEEKGYPSLVAKMMQLSDPVVNAVADEAVTCLNCLQSNNPIYVSVSPNCGIPLTATIMQKDISLQMFYQNKFSAISGIRNVLSMVCSRIFTDILQLVLVRASQVIPNQALVIPGFPHPLFGSVSIVPRPMGYDFPAGGLWGWDPLNNAASEEDRTLFLTFSRGFPVTEDEVRLLFTRLYGDCVDSVHIQGHVPSHEQPLFARMVLRSIATVDQILNGGRIAKFRINGKHIWARKYARSE